MELQDVTLHYDRLPKDHPQARDLTQELELETKPNYLMEAYDMAPAEAVEEAARMVRILRKYEEGKWFYIKLIADTIVVLPLRDEGMPVHLKTDGDVLSSDMPRQAFVHAEMDELQVLHGLLQDRNIFAKAFRAIRLGGFWIPHSGFKSDWEARIHFDAQGRPVRNP